MNGRCNFRADGIRFNDNSGDDKKLQSRLIVTGLFFENNA
jgi:hypothetical protein